MQKIKKLEETVKEIADIRKKMIRVQALFDETQQRMEKQTDDLAERIERSQNLL